MDKVQIERESRKLIERIWRNRSVLFPMGFNDPFDLLEPRVACLELGLQYDPHPALYWYSPETGTTTEIAGLLHRDDGIVAVAQKYGPTIERFTAAHEIGHLQIHPGGVMHREIPEERSGVRPQSEKEADYFAACLLVPANLLIEEFARRFGPPDTFMFDEDSGFWLTPNDPERLLGPGLVRQRALAVASARRFGGKAFASLQERFRVSRSTMAIRLQEVGLIRAFP